MQFKPILSTATAAFTLSLSCMLTAQAQSVTGQGTWETTLLGRDINRNAVAAIDVSAVYLYDTTLGVTWLRDASALGYGDWSTVTTRAANLSTGSGVNTIIDWRLPTMTDTGTSGCNYSNNGTDCGFNPATSTSEMASLFFNTLGNKSYYNTSGTAQAGYGLTNAGSFQNMQPTTYWFGTEDTTVFPANAWLFNISNGHQAPNGKGDQLYALAVRSGDVVAQVPEPETYLMLLMGLGVVGAISRRRSKVLGSLTA